MNAPASNPLPAYWDVFPKLIRVSRSVSAQRIPLSIRGTVNTPVYESTNTRVVIVDSFGTVRCGLVAGAAMILVWDSSQRKSVRHIQVEVFGAAPTDPVV